MKLSETNNQKRMNKIYNYVYQCTYPKVIDIVYNVSYSIPSTPTPIKSCKQEILENNDKMQTTIETLQNANIICPTTNATTLVGLFLFDFNAEILYYRDVIVMVFGKNEDFSEDMCFIGDDNSECVGIVVSDNEMYNSIDTGLQRINIDSSHIHTYLL